MATTTLSAPDRSFSLESLEPGLAGVVQCLRAGHVVLLHRGHKHGQCYHRCAETAADTCVIRVDMTGAPELLNADEWPWYIQNAGTHPCQCVWSNRATGDDRSASFVIHNYAFPGPTTSV